MKLSKGKSVMTLGVIFLRSAPDAQTQTSVPISEITSRWEKPFADIRRCKAECEKRLDNDKSAVGPIIKGMLAKFVDRSYSPRTWRRWFSKR